MTKKLVFVGGCGCGGRSRSSCGHGGCGCSGCSYGFSGCGHDQNYEIEIQQNAQLPSPSLLILYSI